MTQASDVMLAVIYGGSALALVALVAYYTTVIMRLHRYLILGYALTQTLCLLACINYALGWDARHLLGALALSSLTITEGCALTARQGAARHREL